MRISFVGALAASCLFSGGCASIVKGTTQVVTIDSNVKGAEILANGVFVGKTPYNGPLKRGSSTTILVKKAGYETRQMTLSTEIEPVFWGNIICGGFFGSTTDLASQAMYQYAPATVLVDLQRDSGGGSGDGEGEAAPKPQGNSDSGNQG